ncbi:DEAD/DEAH box helicase [Hufsiella ginkgonis]|uniref:Helicase ATP-binding domain-containing protein n=1 Tax=Hufsiella ginkgonis TaxID=2695274 RepID=A0A7K1Y0U0_9SPHI|nr:DEAD/DEAH box helicase [Hufsiella ginkgonis]MXV16855.1 hypothetical protein [Hufsiella ginkgonis]
MINGAIEQIGNVYKITLYKPIPRLLAAVKNLPDRWYAEKVWSVPAHHKVEVERFARVYGFEMGKRPVENPNQHFVIPEMPELRVNIPLKMELRPYQARGVAYGIEKKCFINGDDMGLGKTFQSIATAIALNAFPLLIICPSSVKENWKRELIKFSHLKGIVLQDSIKNSFPEYYRVGAAQVFIVNYESLKKYFVQDIKKDKNGRFKISDISFVKKYVEFFRGVICDEIHKLKDSRTQAYKFTRGITKGKEFVFGLTGTAVVNKPIDLASQLTVVNRLQDFGGVNGFVERYCAGPKQASNLKELNYKLNLIGYYRRNKSDPEIKKHLPDKSRQIIICDLSRDARKEYNHAFNDLGSYMKQYKEATDQQIQRSMRSEVMVRIGILKNISARGKLADAFEFIEDIISQGQKIVVFAYLNDVVQHVQERFPKSVRITGQENSLQKQASVDRFQNDPNINVIVCNLKAAGVGIDGLQNVATDVCFLEFGWHAAVMDQAEDRLYRTGQHKNVMCTYFLGKDTIDEWNYKLIESKREMAMTITGAEDETDVSFIDNMMTLFNQK